MFALFEIAWWPSAGMGMLFGFPLSHSAFVSLMSSLVFVFHYLSLPLVCLFCQMWNAIVSVPDHSLPSSSNVFL